MNSRRGSEQQARESTAGERVNSKRGSEQQAIENHNLTEYSGAFFLI